MAATGARLAGIAAAAGQAVMGHYGRGEGAEFKPDHSPVTAADREAEALILAALEREFPGVPVVAEEAQAAGADVKVGLRFFLVDPLDGTREFLKGNGEFTVNIALVENGVPVAGAVFAPARGRMFFADETGAFEQSGGAARRIQTRRVPASGPVALCSRSHDDAQTQAYLKKLGVQEITTLGSSLKFCLLAAGEADLYARAGRTMEWDIAAGHAILSAAGGVLTDWDGGAFLYGKPGFANGGFIARGRV